MTLEEERDKLIKDNNHDKISQKVLALLFPFKKTHPYTILLLPFYNLSDSLPPRGQSNTIHYTPKKGSSELSYPHANSL